MISGDLLANIYFDIQEYLLDRGYVDELLGYLSPSIGEIDEPTFLAEGAWVILTSGFRTSVVERVFPRVSEAFLDWESAQVIASRENECIEAAHRVFHNLPKLTAIVVLCEAVSELGLAEMKAGLICDGPDYFQQFPFFGPATSRHFAKNIGLDCVKPDRHLLRISSCLGWDSPHDLCTELAALTGDRLGTVDSILWRYGTLDSEYDLLRWQHGRHGHASAPVA